MKTCELFHINYNKKIKLRNLLVNCLTNISITQEKILSRKIFKIFYNSKFFLP